MLLDLLRGLVRDMGLSAIIVTHDLAVVRLLADRIAAGQVGRAVDIGRMNGRYFANGAGIGFDARVTQIARSYRMPIGDFVYQLRYLGDARATFEYFFPDLIPGEPFGVPNHLRLSFADSEETLREAGVRIKRALESFGG